MFFSSIHHHLQTLPRLLIRQKRVCFLPSSSSLLWCLHSNFYCRKHDLLNPPKGEKLLLHVQKPRRRCSLDSTIKLSKPAPKMNKHQFNKFLWDTHCFVEKGLLFSYTFHGVKFCSTGASFNLLPSVDSSLKEST
ncbi:hypothetical protein P8452_27133 [Trifolium repens]|nr:hypothetical protein P8452_27133 [Trifolium repens]